MAMKWFWRMVCAPDCSDACQTNCPGCHALADEWEQQGHTTAVTGGNATPGRWRDFRYAVSCWTRSASGRWLVRLDPRRIVRREAVPAPATAGGCGCHGHQADSAGLLQVATDAGISLRPAGRDDPVRGAVREHYDQQAREVRDHAGNGAAGGLLPAEVSAASSYPAEDLRTVPTGAVEAFLGCGNPFARAGLEPGEVVLDLGSGGGMDALVAARRVAPDGHVFGLDMSDDMMALAQRNAAAAGVPNVAFLKGDMESVPLPRESIDVIISNCVVNLVPDKARAMREAHRVLRPGGRLSISDIVTRRPVPERFRRDLSAWAACIGGALSEEEYRAVLTAAGFVDIEIERDREFTAADADLAGLTPILERSGLTEALELGFANTSVRARKLVREATDLRPTDRVPALSD
jgi:SAM-dependent methyltransferase